MVGHSKTQQRALRRVGLLAMGLVLLAAVDCAVAAPLASLAQQRLQLAEDYAAELERLAQWCSEGDLDELATRTLDWIPRRDPFQLGLIALDEPGAGRPADAGASDSAREWDERFREIRRAQAEELFRLSRSAMRGRRVSLAYELVLEVLREDPDHLAARRLLGFQKFRDGWHTPYAVRKLRGGSVWHERFGWLPAAYVKRYEEGRRHFNGRWITVKEERELRARLKQPWTIETEHYNVTTTHSLEAAVHLGVRLERLYRAWGQLFASYYTGPDQLARRFEGRAPGRASTRRHQVVYFRDRQEYKQALRGAIPEGVETTGIYLGDRRCAFFFADGMQDDSTLYHEATHQLFSESRAVVPDVGREANFWVIEGVACYMESLVNARGGYALGGRDAVRLQDAVYRGLEDESHIPLTELVTWGMNRFQQVERFEADVRLPMLYSQSAGLTHFLIHYDDGRYRDALVGYLLALYSGRDRPSVLAELTRVGFVELDRQYREFLESAR